MAIYHFSVKTISRSTGRTATAAAAYRAGQNITDHKTGEVHKYGYKKGVRATGIVLPEGAPKWAHDREKLWNEAEKAETRKNSTVAREIVIALPAELDAAARARMVRGFAEKLAIKHKVAVDFAIHEPNSKGDDRNHHAHLLLSTRRLRAEGFTEKTREWDDRKTGTVEEWRKEWAIHTNRYLSSNGRKERVSHESLSAQGIEREPTKHKGVAATAMERRNRAAKQTEKMQVSEQSESLSGYDFGQKAPVVEDPNTAEIISNLYEKISLDSVTLLFVQTNELEKAQMDLHALMEERSELVREMEAERLALEASKRVIEILPKLTPIQALGFQTLIQASAKVRDGSDHLPYTDRWEQFGKAVGHLADEAAAGRNLMQLEMMGRLTAQQQARPQAGQSQERSDDYEMDR